MCVCGEKVGEIPVPDNNLRSLALNHILVVELRLFFPLPTGLFWDAIVPYSAAMQSTLGSDLER